MKVSFHIIGAICAAAVCGLFLSASAKATGSPDSASGSAKVLIENEHGTSNTASQNASEKSSHEEKRGHCVSVTPYMQNDPAWADFLYGGQDPMSGYGCGPTALAIAAASLTHESITPIDTASWAADNGYYAPQNGSVHALIPDGARNYGLTIEILNTRTPDAFRLALSMDKLLVLLMGPGDFSDSGHFIVLYGYDENGDILVADPASPERSSKHWPADTLINQLLMTAKNGGPVWVLSKP